MSLTDISREEALRQLEWVAKQFPNSEQAQYLRIGKWFSNEPLSDDERAELRYKLANVHAFKPGECYMNAGKIALEVGSGLSFVEGYAAGFWPVPHAWIEYRGRAIDVTWPTRWTARRNKPAYRIETIMQRVEHNIKTCSYLGVAIPENMLRTHVMKLRQWSPLFDGSFHAQWPEFEKLLTDRKYPATICLERTT